MQVCNFGQQVFVKSPKVGALIWVFCPKIIQDEGWIDADQLSGSKRLRKYKPYVTQNIILGLFFFFFSFLFFLFF